MKSFATLSYSVIALSLVAIIMLDYPVVRYVAAVVIGICLFYLSRCFSTSMARDISSSSNGANKHADAEVVNQELDRLFELLESAIKEDLIVVKQELLQIKGLVNNAVGELTKSFYGISSNSDDLLRLVQQLTNLLEASKTQQTLTEIDKTNKLIRDNSADAVRSLQFEDIVIQVSDNSLQYIDNLDKFLKEFRQRLASRLNSASTSNDASGLLRSCVSDVKEIRQDIQLPDRKAVHQNNLSEGGVELF